MPCLIFENPAQSSSFLTFANLSQTLTLHTFPPLNSISAEHFLFTVCQAGTWK